MKLIQWLLIVVLIGTTGVAGAKDVARSDQQDAVQDRQIYQACLYGQPEYFAHSGDPVAVIGKMSHVPEPEGWHMWLVGLGLVVVQIIRRSRRSKAWNLSQEVDGEANDENAVTQK